MKKEQLLNAIQARVARTPGELAQVFKPRKQRHWQAQILSLRPEDVITLNNLATKYRVSKSEIARSAIKSFLQIPEEQARNLIRQA